MPIEASSRKVFQNSDPAEFQRVLAKEYWDSVDVMVYLDFRTLKTAQNWMAEKKVRRMPNCSRLTKKKWVDEAMAAKCPLKETLKEE